MNEAKDRIGLTHSAEGLPAVQSVDHANLGVRSASSDNERQHGHGVDLLVCHLVESGDELSQLKKPEGRESGRTQRQLRPSSR